MTKDYRGYVTAPRFAGVPTFIKNLCHMLDLNLDIDVDTGWITQTTRYTICGAEETVRSFEKQLNDALKNYEKGVN